MKKFLFLVMVVTSCFTVKAQMHTFKTQPYTFVDATKASRTIVGIKAKMIGSIDCNLSDSTFFRSFYIVFTLSTGADFDEINSDTDKFVEKLVSSGYTLPQAKVLIKSICSGLEYGNKQQKYDAAKSLALGYGYTLLPLNEQE